MAGENPQRGQKQFVTSVECREIAELMGRKYGSQTGERYFDVSFDADSYGVYAKVILRNESGSFYYPVEGRLAYEEQGLAGRDAALFLFDYIDLYFEEYLREGGEVYLPIDWADYECEDVKLQLKGQILNLEAERMADDFLAGRSTADTNEQDANPTT